jgi:hypothetical protein
VGSSQEEDVLQHRSSNVLAVLGKKIVDGFATSDLEYAATNAAGDAIHGLER